MNGWINVLSDKVHKQESCVKLLQARLDFECHCLLIILRVGHINNNSQPNFYSIGITICIGFL